VRTVPRAQGDASLASRLVVGPGSGGDGGRPGPGGSVALTGGGGSSSAFGEDGKGESGYPLGGDGGAGAQHTAGGAGGLEGGHGQGSGYLPGVFGSPGSFGRGGTGNGPNQVTDNIGNPSRQATYAGGGGGGGGGSWYGGGGGGGGGTFDSNGASPPQFPGFMEAGAGGGGGGGIGYSASGTFRIITVPFDRGPDGSVVITYNQITVSQPTIAPGGNGAAATISCAGNPCTISMQLSVTESISGGQVVAVGARVVRRTVVIGKARVTLRPGTRKRVSVMLNSSGRTLEATHKHLRARLRIFQLATGAKPVLLTNALLKLK
jgi:hypothetical protein